MQIRAAQKYAVIDRKLQSKTTFSFSKDMSFHPCTMQANAPNPIEIAVVAFTICCPKLILSAKKRIVDATAPHSMITGIITIRYPLLRSIMSGITKSLKLSTFSCARLIRRVICPSVMSLKQLCANTLSYTCRGFTCRKVGQLRCDRRAGDLGKPISDTSALSFYHIVHPPHLFLSFDFSLCCPQLPSGGKA